MGKPVGVRKQQNRSLYIQICCLWFMRSLSYKSLRGEGMIWRAVATNLHCSCPLPLTLLVSWRQVTGPAGHLVSPSALFFTYKLLRQIIPVCQTCRCVKKCKTWAFQKCQKENKNYLFVCLVGRDWKVRDSWYPGLTASWSLVLPSVQVSWIWWQLWIYKSPPTLNCIWAKVMVRVGGVGVPRLDPDLEITSPISGCRTEAELPDKTVFQNVIRKKLPRGLPCHPPKGSKCFV